MPPLRGQKLSIDAPTAAERAWIFDVLQDAQAHVPLGCRRGPTRDEYTAGELTLWRGDAARAYGFRAHVLRATDPERPAGFFLDFGWDYAQDTTRELDLVLRLSPPRVSVYAEALLLGAVYLLAGRHAKRLRWRVVGRPGSPPRRGVLLGARHIGELTQAHPITGAPQTQHLFELARADLQRLSQRLGVDLCAPSGRLPETLWRLR